MSKLRLLGSLVWRLTWAPLSLLLLAVLGIVAVWAMLHSEWGTARLLANLPGVSVVGGKGALLGDFEADRLEVELARQGRVVWQRPRWQAMSLQWDHSAPWWLGLHADELGGSRIDVHWVPDPQAKPSPPPDDLSLPVSLTVTRLAVAELHGLTGTQPLRNLQAQVRIGAMRHAVRLRSLNWTDWSVSGDLGVAATGAMAVEADLVAQGSRPGGEAGEGLLSGSGEINLHVRGPMKELGVQLAVRWQPEQGARQSLDGDLTVKAFAPWPVPRGRLGIEALDLAALWPGLPRSAIHGRVEFNDQAVRDLVASVDLRNDMPGAWDQGRLPWVSASGQLALDRAVAARSEVDAWRDIRTGLSVLLPGRTAQQPARLQLEGPLMGRQPLRVAVQDLAPRALMGSLPDLSLAGDVRWTPNPARQDLSGALDVRLAGTVHEVAGRAFKSPVALSLASQLSPGQWTVKSLQLDSGDARARVNDANVRWGLTPAQGGWDAKGGVRLERFDPRVWVPWPAALSGATSLSGEGQFEVDGSGSGTAGMALAASSLAGVPFSGKGQWTAPRAGSEMTLSVQAQLGGNRLELSGQGPRSLAEVDRPSQGLQWQLAVDAPDLASLSPLATAWGAEHLRGQLKAQAHGAWPLKSLKYAVQAHDLSATRADQVVWQLASLEGEGDIDLWQPEGRTVAKWVLEGVRLPSWQVSRLAFVMDGHAAAHRIQLEGDGAPLRSGEVDSARAVRLALALTGQWRRGASEQAWQARLNEAQLSWLQPNGRPPLLRLEPLSLSWQANAQRAEWTASPAGFRVMGLEGALERLVWRTPSDAAGRGGAAVAEALHEVSVTLPPFPLAPWLALWQPEEGWSGDLVSSGQLKMLQRGTQPWEVDLLVARQSGDLSFAESSIEGARPQRLGLREARVSLRARQGVWTAEQRFDGRVLGLLTGRQVVQPLRADAWPDATSTLSGELKLDVANLRALATWVPAGWRLGGQAQVQARLGGTLGQPQFNGQVEGSALSASQALLGISLQDGSLSMSLDGERIRLNRLEATGGPQGGRVAMDGELRLASPLSGRLSLTADRFAALQRIDRRVVLSGRAETTLTDWQMAVKGDFRVDEGLIDISRAGASTIGDDVTVINRPGEEGKPIGAAASSGPQGKQLTLDANIGVNLGDQLRLRGHGVSGLLKGQLQVSTPRNKPAIHGAIRMEQGKFAAYGQKLDIVRSAITFNGLIENPRLDILAMRPQSPAAQDSDVKVGVRITGTAQDPRIRLYSEPTLSETEQLSWLVLGRAPTGLGGADIGLLQSAAVALLSGDDGPGVTDRVIGLLGLDTLSVSQSDGAVRDTVVTVGKQLSRHWYMGYERNLSATGGNWQLIYSLAQRFKLRAQAGEDNAIDLIWQWRWR